MPNKVTVHVICNAHLDPVWLWPWQSGLDEVLATCRTMCNLLERNPDMTFTANEAWRYWEIERLDPALFARIRTFVQSGRWEITGGWWLQPDCNFPSGAGMRKQITLGRDYFLDRFGQFPDTGYNVDSFGHAATLPTILREFGQKHYVMMRPGSGERTLPSRLFRWKENATAPEVLTFRIAGSYGTWNETPSLEQVRQAMTELPEGIRHTMLFVGLGDHGGGPSQRMLDWIREHATRHEDFELVFSSTRHFFQAITPDAARLPEVIGELQHHAIGCYSVMRAIKEGAREAECRLSWAENVAAPEDRPALEDAWRATAFNQFHDIVGGTSLPSAYQIQCAQIGGAVAAADDILQHALRRRYLELPDDPLQRIVICNPTDRPYEGYVEFAPSLRPHTWKPGEQLLDESGREVPYQQISSENVNEGCWSGFNAQLRWRTELAPGQLRVYRLHRAPATPLVPQLTLAADAITACSGVDFSATGGLFHGDTRLCTLPELTWQEDTSDNWTHVLDRYPDGPLLPVQYSRPYLIHSGTLSASMGRQGTLGRSTVQEEWLVCAGESWIELKLSLFWAEKQKLAKLVIPLDGVVAERIDGTMGGSLTRCNDGRELPLQDWTLLTLQTGRLAIVSPDVFALDADPRRLRLTLLRSPILTHHDPNQPNRSRAVYADQGEHTFRIRFYPGTRATPEYLAAQALQMRHPLLCGDLTRGMPCL